MEIDTDLKLVLDAGVGEGGVFGEHIPCVYNIKLHFFKTTVALFLSWNVGVSLNFKTEFNKTQYA